MSSDNGEKHYPTITFTKRGHMTKGPHEDVVFDVFVTFTLRLFFVLPFLAIFVSNFVSLDLFMWGPYPT